MFSFDPSGINLQLNQTFISTDNNNCYAVGDNGTMIKTIDGEEHWTVQETNTTQKRNAITCNNHDCNVVGDGGIVLKATGIIPEKIAGLTSELQLFPTPSAGDVTIRYNTALGSNVRSSR
ncbi:MAG TPA: hypothetical protein PK289_10705 [Bacteroidia bacterium]|nr:hypothetical protein [Bacteroidia bacterium]HRG51253.1 hypothetical protein [Bacteroidia bacterium]